MGSRWVFMRTIADVLSNASRRWQDIADNLHSNRKIIKVFEGTEISIKITCCYGFGVADSRLLIVSRDLWCLFCVTLKDCVRWTCSQDSFRKSDARVTDPGHAIQWFISGT